MELKTLTVLKRDNNSDLYDIYQPVINYNRTEINNSAIEYITTQEDEMRMDLICDNIYGDTNQVDFLCNINNIKNPLLVKSDINLIYVPSNSIPGFVPERSSDNIKIREVISNKRKATKTDPKRSKFLEEKSQSLPPSITKQDFNAVKYSDGKISIGDGIFKI